jgi:Holliday junction DNA helicase RuvB
MNHHNEDEIIHILRRSSKILEINCKEDAIKFLSTCCRGTPRVANRLLRRIRDFAQVKGSGIITEDIVKYSLEKLNIDELGLELCDRQILDVIINKYSGGPVGAETLAISVGESVETLEDFYEPYLIQIGMIKRTPRGRVATQLAYEHLNIFKKENGNEEQRFLF